ncbi:MAG: AAA domain-containing protein [Thermodesulfobacteriota bacterium]
MAGLDNLNEKFFLVTRVGSWLPRPGRPWRHTVPLGRHLGPMIEQLASAGQDALLVLGYPLQVVKWQREGEPDSFLLKPVFHYALDHELSQGSLVLQADHPHAQINLEWMHHTFKDAEKRRGFLSACGFLGGDDDAAPASRSGPSLDHLAATLAAFLSRELQEPLLPDAIPSSDFRPPLTTGIYNRAVVMLARRPQYTKTLLKELAAIAEFPDSELDKTALRLLFRAEGEHARSENEPSRANVQVADVTNLNSEQRNAVECLLNQPITVVTGPPGTGKSQVVSAAIANIHLCSQSVLFSSRNHKAIDAVHARCRCGEGQSLLVRCNSRDDPGLRETFTSAIGRLLAGQADEKAAEAASPLLTELRRLLDVRAANLKQLEVFRAYRERLGELEEKVSLLVGKLPEALLSTLGNLSSGFPEPALQRVEEAARLLLRGPGDTISRWVAWRAAMAAMPAWITLGRKLRRIPGLPAPEGLISTPGRIEAFRRQLGLLRDAAEYCAALAFRAGLEKEVRLLADEPALVSDVSLASEQIMNISTGLLEKLALARGGLLPADSRELYANLRSALGFLEQATASTSLQQEVKEVLRTQLPKLLEHYPAWAVTSLSAGSRIPLLPGVFDLVIVDEASQSDIPSAIPLLFRARRAGVVGDPQQLTHVTTLSLAKDTMLRRRAGMDRLAQQRFSFVESSLYALFADTDGVSPILLCETYRSVEEIAAYSNDLFYGGRLRVATDVARLPVVSGMKPGLHWDEVQGDVRSGGSGGAFCAPEVEAITDIVREILADGSFKGSLGVVTPFREQANRLREAIHDGGIPWEALRSARVVVDTSHGFQGDERDVILFSLCAGPGMPQGGLHFLRENGNLFNVAISRARAVARIVGNRAWARNCGIQHVERLAMPRRAIVHSPADSPWAPHESPWEKKLAEALMAHGLSPVPQHPVAGRRLDLALFSGAPRPRKIDIEVDGACCHRNSDGSRKLDDLWRDIQLQGLGWKVMRFWVYQLREDMDGCVERILHQWRNADEHAA